MICWKVDKNSPLPIYKQLVNLVRDSVASGQLRKGEVLPSQRQLAKLLGLSRATIVKAMEEMTDAGLVDIKERNQAVVSDLSTKGVQWNVYFRRSGHRYCNIQKSSRIDGKEINLSRLRLSSEYSDCDTNLKSLRRIEQIIGTSSVLRRDDIHGIEPLQTAMLEYLNQRGVACSRDELLLVASPVQAISFVAELLLCEGVHLYYSSPSDINYFGYLDSYGAQLHPLPSDPEGVVVDSLLAEGNPKNDKVLFIWSSCNPPTNVSLSKGRRDKILSVCKTHNIPVIDNCMLELYNLEKDGPNYLFRQGFSDGVVQIGAFPRGMAAGTWLSWIVAPKSVILRLEDIKEKRFRTIHILSQKILLHLLETGELQNYHDSVREKIREDTFSNNYLIQKYLGDIADWNRRASGWCLVIHFKKPINTKLLFESRQGISFNPGFFYDPLDTQHIMLNPPSLTKEQFEEGLKKLREEILYLFPEAFNKG